MLLNGPYRGTQEIGGLGLGGRVRSDAHSDGQIQQSGEQERSSRRPETHVHPGGVGRRSFVALGPQRGREGGMCDSGGSHERCVVRCKQPPFSASRSDRSLTASFVCSFLQQEPEGVMTVKFRDPISAKACIIVSRPFYRNFPVFASHPRC